MDRTIGILNKRWTQHETLEKIGESFKITKTRVGQIEKKALEVISKELARCKPKGLTERFIWIENQLSDELDQCGGYSTIPLVESWLGWHNGSFKSWVGFNSLFGVLNPERKTTGYSGEGSGAFGSLEYDGWLLSNVQNGFKHPNWNTLFNDVTKAVGCENILRLGDLGDALDQATGRSVSAERDTFKTAKSLEQLKMLDILGPPTENTSQLESWVACGLSQRTREIARAIIFGSRPTENEGRHLREGLRLALITDWLKKHSLYKPNSRAIKATCERHPSVFVQTAPNSWGLLAAGATKFSVRNHDETSPSVLNFGPAEPNTLNLVRDALSNEPTWLTEEEVLDRVREGHPDANPGSVSIYLRNLERKGSIERSANGKYRARQAELGASD